MSISAKKQNPTTKNSNSPEKTPSKRNKTVAIEDFEEEVEEELIEDDDEDLAEINEENLMENKNKKRKLSKTSNVVVENSNDSNDVQLNEALDDEEDEED